MELENGYNHKVEERKRYFKSFGFWMVAAAICLIIFLVMKITHKEEAVVKPERNNTVAPAQRVYDFADKLTDSEEKALEKLIAEQEDLCQCDLVLVIINKEMGVSDTEWTRNMVNYADDFYDQNAFGYDQPHGDGALLLDNWYHAGEADSQAGTWLSTSGKLERNIGESEENRVWDALDSGFDISAKEAYARAIRKVAYYGIEEEGSGVSSLPWVVVLAIPAIIAGIYCAANMKQAPGKDTTNSMTYVAGNQPQMNNQADQFLRKNTTKVKIETSSGSRSGGGGSYGHHTSSGGFSHGGGGHRR